jgi:hypothetical protein
VAAHQNLDCDQGAKFSQSLLWKDADGATIDLTGYTARMEIRSEIPSSDILLTLETNPKPGGGAGNGRITLGLVEDTPGGTDLYNILLEIDATDTASLVTNNEKQVWRYDLELLPADDEDEVVRLLQGKFVVFPEVTR